MLRTRTRYVWLYLSSLIQLIRWSANAVEKSLSQLWLFPAVALDLFVPTKLVLVLVVAVLVSM